MAPDMIIALMTVILISLYGISQAVTWQRNGGLTRLLALIHPQSSSPPSKARRRVRVIRRRSQVDIRNERILIRAGLAAGLDAAWIAHSLRGSPVYNQRRVAIAARQKQLTD